jgi:hypothetical protein
MDHFRFSKGALQGQFNSWKVPAVSKNAMASLKDVN